MSCRVRLQSIFYLNPVLKCKLVRSSVGLSLPPFITLTRKVEAMHVTVPLDLNRGSKLLSCLNLK